MIRAESLCFNLGQFQFGPLSFEWPGPGIHFIVGPNGSGKTSLLRCLMGTQRLHSGRLEGIPPQVPFATIGMASGFIEGWTLLENIEWVARLANQDVRPEELQLIWPYRHLKFSYLSAGMKRQSELSLFLSLAFRFYFLDEAFHHLDRQNRATYLDLVQKRADQGAMIFLTGHYEEEFAELKIQSRLAL